jgi:hypothetical protein
MLTMGERGDWQPIETAPEKPAALLLFSARLVFHDARSDASVTPEPHERYEIGYWDGDDYFWSGTNHRIFEQDRPGSDYLPTHWMPLPSPPPRSGASLPDGGG